MNCPFCEYTNIQGSRVCDQCGQPIDDLHLSDPESALERGLLADRIEELSPKAPITVTSDATVGDVLNLLFQQSIGCVFVLDENRHPIGVFSERDATRAAEAIATSRDRPIVDFMTPNPQGLSAEAKIAFAVHQMDLGGYRHLPIINAHGQADGVISVRDILRYLTEKANASV